MKLNRLMNVSVLAVAGVSLLAVSERARADEGSVFGVSVPETLINGNAFWGGYVDWLAPVAPGFQLGLESGFQYRSETVAGISVHGFDVPVLLTGLYNIDIGQAAFTPFVGLGLGVGILHAGGSFTSDDGSVATGSDTEVKFEGLAHVGAKLGTARNFFIDFRLGLVDSSFAFAPSIGVFF